MEALHYKVFHISALDMETNTAYLNRAGMIGLLAKI